MLALTKLAMRQLLIALFVVVTDASRALAARADDHYFRSEERSFFLDNSALSVFLIWPRVPLDEIKLLHKNLPLIGNDAQDLAGGTGGQTGAA